MQASSPCGADAAGNVCILYSVTRQAFSVQNGLNACSCHTLCLGEETCAFRKFCASSRKRFDCQGDPLLRDSEANPCPRRAGRWLSCTTHNHVLDPLTGTSMICLLLHRLMCLGKAALSGNQHQKGSVRLREAFIATSDTPNSCWPLCICTPPRPPPPRPVVALDTTLPAGVLLAALQT